MFSRNILCSRVSAVAFRNKKRFVPCKPLFESLKRCYPATYDGDGKTTATILNIQEETLMISSYSPHGFRLSNKLFVRGPLVLFPSTTLGWQVQSIEDVNEASLSLFYLVEPKLDIVVIGVGDKENCTKERVKFLRGIMRKYGIPVEVLPTDTACTTFNFLAAEDRFVGGALYPAFKGYDMSTDAYEGRPDQNIFT